MFNNGEIAGYVAEITDYLPEGMRFIQSYNPLWESAGQNRITTRALERTRIEPGKYVDIEILLRWINDGENLGSRQNVARISDSRNDYNAPDIDPYNEKDYAWIILERETGETVIFIPLIGGIVTILTGGLFLIKRYVLM